MRNLILSLSFLTLFSCTYNREEIEVIIELEKYSFPRSTDLIELYKLRFENCNLRLNSYKVSANGLTLLIDVPNGYESQKIELLIKSKGEMSNYPCPSTKEIGEAFFQHPDTLLTSAILSKFLNTDFTIKNPDRQELTSLLNKFKNQKGFYPTIKFEFVPLDKNYSKLIIYNSDPDSCLNLTEKLENITISKNSSDDVLAVSLSEEYKKEMLEFSQRNKGKQIAISVDTCIYWYAMINDSISTGVYHFNFDKQLYKTIKEVTTCLQNQAPYLEVKKVLTKSTTHYNPSENDIKKYNVIKSQMTSIGLDRLGFYIVEKDELEQTNNLINEIMKLPLSDYIRVHKLKQSQVNELFESMEDIVHRSQHQKEENLLNDIKEFPQYDSNRAVWKSSFINFDSLNKVHRK